MGFSMHVCFQMEKTNVEQNENVEKREKRGKNKKRNKRFSLHL